MPGISIVEQHDAGPVLFIVFALRLAEKLDFFFGYVVVFYDLDCIGIVAQRPQSGNVVEKQHVAVHE